MYRLQISYHDCTLNEKMYEIIKSNTKRAFHSIIDKPLWIMSVI